MVSAICQICEAVFWTYPSVISRGRRFCSAKCRLVFMGTFSGSNSWHWRGGHRRDVRAAREVAATVGRGVTSSEWESIKSRHGHRCASCGIDAEVVGFLTKDHIVPLARGGSHQASNIQPLCLRCNQVKHLRTIAFSEGRGVEVTDVRAFIASVIDGRTPLEAIRLNWPFLNQAAEQSKGTLAIAGIEAVEIGSVRAKGGRAK